MPQKREMPTLAGLAQDMAFLVNAPAGADLSRLQGALRILIEMTRHQEREACATVCNQMQQHYKKFYRVKRDDQPYDPAHCALVIRERSNANVTGLAPAQETTK